VQKGGKEIPDYCRIWTCVWQSPLWASVGSKLLSHNACAVG